MLLHSDGSSSFDRREIKWVIIGLVILLVGIGGILGVGWWIARSF